MVKVQNAALPEGNAAVSSANALALSDLQPSVRYADRPNAWTVFLCHIPEMVTTLRNLLISVLPAGSSSSGRTMLLPSGARISVSCITEAVFIPDGQPFEVICLGWGDATPKQLGGLARWERKAAKTVDLTKLLGPVT